MVQSSKSRETKHTVNNLWVKEEVLREYLKTE